MMVETTTSPHAYTFGSVTYDLSSRTHIMGVLNVTPDSFSDGGKFFGVDNAVRHALEMVNEGADFIDVGGESTRPGSDPVPLEEELRRIIPVIERLSKETSVPISIDTYKSAVAAQALEAGAVIVNDISGLHFDPKLVDVVADRNASIVLMHIKGTPKTMQQNPEYENVIEEIIEYLQQGIQTAEQRGIRQIMIDPGIGFGKKLEHNLKILRNLQQFHRLRYPLLIGPSRKSFIGMILDLSVEERLEGTAAAVAVSVINGAHVVRVHDVRQIKRIVRVIDTILQKPSP
jgi:dihydropteroate synthase